eukprot:SAG25_NODE_4431_length_816_cov_0.852162_1_plen_75_part_00
MAFVIIATTPFVPFKLFPLYSNSTRSSYDLGVIGYRPARGDVSPRLRYGLEADVPPRIVARDRVCVAPPPDRRA